LPSGLRINSTTGVISGTPTRAATYTPIIYAQNGVSPRTSRRYTLTVTP
jgi:hypothetical protein